LRITAAASMPYASSFFSGATANIGSEFFVVQNWETASKGQMQRKLIQLGATLILTLCIWGHVSEIFDYWDNTFQTGNDIEYSTVIVALIAGAGFGIAYSPADPFTQLFQTATRCLRSQPSRANPKR
jgi:hypothetical protein